MMFKRNAQLNLETIQKVSLLSIYIHKITQKDLFEAYIVDSKMLSCIDHNAFVLAISDNSLTQSDLFQLQRLQEMAGLAQPASNFPEIVQTAKDEDADEDEDERILQEVRAEAANRLSNLTNSQTLATRSD
jgi:hypothetical protein